MSKSNLNAELYVLQNNLKRTDYQALKYAEGALTEAEYAPIKAQRQAWRTEINRLKTELNKK